MGLGLGFGVMGLGLGFRISALGLFDMCRFYYIVHNMLSFGESQNLAMYELGTYMIYRCGSVTHHRLASYLLGVRVSILVRKDNQCFIGYYYRELD